MTCVCEWHSRLMKFAIVHNHFRVSKLRLPRDTVIWMASGRSQPLALSSLCEAPQGSGILFKLSAKEPGLALGPSYPLSPFLHGRRTDVRTCSRREHLFPRGTLRLGGNHRAGLSPSWTHDDMDLASSVLHSLHSDPEDRAGSRAPHGLSLVQGHCLITLSGLGVPFP